MLTFLVDAKDDISARRSRGHLGLAGIQRFPQPLNRLVRGQARLKPQTRSNAKEMDHGQEDGNSVADRQRDTIGPPGILNFNPYPAENGYAPVFFEFWVCFKLTDGELDGQRTD